MIKYLYLLTVATVLMADISLMDALKTREIGSGGEKISLSVKDRIKDEKQVELNVPERFGAKIIHYKTILANGKIYEGNDDSKVPDACTRIYFNNGKFNLFCKFSRDFFSDVRWTVKINYIIKWVGTYTKKGFLDGTYSLYQENFNINPPHQIPKGIYMKVYHKGIIRGNIVNNNEIILNIYVNKETVYDKTHGAWEKRNQKFSPWKYIYKLSMTDFQSNGYQTAMSEIAKSRLESEPIQGSSNISQQTKQPMSHDVNTPKTQESGTTSHPKPYDVCKDPSFKDDKDFKEYCRKLADNAKLAAQEEAEEKAQEEADAKAEAEYEAEMEKWNREEEEYNRKLKKELDAQTRAWRKAWKAQDKAFNESIARDQTTRRAVQAEIAKAHKIVNRFGGDIESQMLAHKKIDKLADLKSINKAKKIKNAIKKQFYDSKQISLQGESEYQNAKANELDKTSKTLKTISDTAITIDKVIALPAAIESMGVEEVAVEATEVLGGAEATEGATIAESSLTKQIGNAIKLKLKDDKFLASTAIPTVQGMATNAIDASQTDGLKGATVSIVKDTVDTIVPFKIGSEVIDQQYRKHKYYGGDGLDVPNGVKYYDKNHYLIKKIKYGDRVYNEKGDDITNGVRRHMLRYQFLVSKIDNDFKKGDINKKINATLDTKDATTQVIEGSGKMWNIGRKVINYYLEKDTN